MGKFRVVFVGYHDFNDPDRVVCQPFVVVSETQTVVVVIDREETIGDTDKSEDVVTGLNRVLTIDWQGDDQVLVHLAHVHTHDLEKYFHDD